MLAARLWLAGQVATPWILIDELLYAGLAESLAREGRLAVRGEPLATSVLYPALIAPAWLAREMETTYALAKAINVLAMSAAAVPAFVWARRLAGVRAGVVAGGLTLLLPGLAYTTALMTENLFFPLFLVAAFALALALERPSPPRWVLALAAIALTVATRAQGLVLAPVAVVAVLLYALFEWRGGRPGAARSVLARSLPWAALPLAALVAVRAGAPLPLVEVAPYRGALEAGYDAGAVLRWAAHNAGGLAVAAGVVPALALAALAGRAGGEASTAERAFVAVCVASVLALVALAAATSTLAPLGIRERYAFHVVPLLLIAFAVWLARDAPRPRLALAAIVPAVLLVATMPLRTIFTSQSFLGDGFSLIAFWRLARILPGGVEAAWVVLVAGALVAAIAFVAVPRRLAGPLLPLALAAYFVASSAAVGATVRSQALGVSLASGQHERPTWVDEAVGADAEVVFVSAVPAEPPEWVPVWQAEFWNRSVAGVLVAGAPEPTPLPQRAAADEPAPELVLVREGLDVAGEVIASRGPLHLVRAERPLRILAP